MRILRLPSLALVLIWQICFWSPLSAQDITIEITGAGGNAKFIEAGQTRQRPVGAKVGQTVRWQNVNTTRSHTATAANENGSIIFDTGVLASPGDSKDVVMTREVFEAAGGQPGSMVTIEYECEFHPQMVSYIVLCDEGKEDNRELNIRRDIVSLSPAELTAYRDAWAEIQSNGAFADLAGYHGCPQGLCHGNRSIFLPWHREYILRLEQALQAVDPSVALHYWNWNSDSAASTGIPSVFTDSTYVSAGITRANPLRRFQFVCPQGAPPTTTSRSPGPASSLASFAGLVTSNYLSSNYNQFNSGIDMPHGSVHVWIGGQMRNISFAAYDPIFWAHHSNVDRQWASWQENGGPGPTAPIGGQSLPGFTGRVADDVTDFKLLGYEYDFYDSIPITMGGLVMDESVMGGDSDDEFRKSFSVALPEADATESAIAGQANIGLFVKGIPAHPKRSYMVHVFVNTPNASPADIRPDNPNYLGQFGIFGGQFEGADHNMNEGVEQDLEQQVLLLQPGALRTINALESVNPRNQITIVATNEQGELTSLDELPIDAVGLKSPQDRTPVSAPETTPATGRGAGTGQWQEFVGLSSRESFDEAYRKAAAKAELALGSGDQEVIIEVLETRGSRGTIAGKRDMEVLIRARTR